MAEVKQREFEELKMKGVRRRIEESWPRTTSSYEPNMRDERSHASEQDIEHPSIVTMFMIGWFDRDQTSTRVHRQQSPPYSHGSRREKTDKTSRYERRYHEDQNQPQEKGVVKEIPNRFQVPSDSVRRDHPSFCDDQMSQESRVKRMKRDNVRRSRHQDSSSLHEPGLRVSALEVKGNSE
ncbi:hypothetical protein OS493_036718 [Desmophyllum pertusum]|uniref:Uncharacterized protein n=1 Tax=Desmophyllum pertusum TaxID=174260 RepID=A0A9X0D0F3_9CNID|nr:hypothetical protein OS493_036718 [Desmophyllum pertusum]